MMNKRLFNPGLLEAAVHNILTAVGEDGSREGLRETPQRVAKAFREWTSGYEQAPEEVLKVFADGAANYDQMVFQGSIPVYSLCEHHMAPFFGIAHLAYIPQGKIVGLSKLARLVNIYARRLQVQERLTDQIADALHTYLKPQGVGVVVRCRHLCMESRGIRQAGTSTITSALRGSIKDEPETRAEFLKLVDIAEKGGISI